MDLLGSEKAIKRWALASLAANVVIIWTGALVRLTKSGLGCPTWPQCNAGSYVPVPESGVHGVIEFTNRTLTFVLVALSIGLFLAALRAVRDGRRPRRLVPLTITIGPVSYTHLDVYKRQALALAGCTAPAASGGGHKGGGEANLHLPDLHIATFFGGAINGWALLLIGLLICVFGLGFGLWTYRELKSMPVHASMLEMSELIYETCKAYLVQQGKFLMRLWGAIAVVIVMYFAISGSAPLQIGVILLFSLIGMAGSYAIAWYGIRVNTFANSRTAFAALRGRPYDCHNIPMRSGMSVGMMLISVELFFMLGILLFVPGQMAGSCFIGFAVGESLGASAPVSYTHLDVYKRQVDGVRPTGAGRRWLLGLSPDAG